jgi:RNA processing factor Prp31
MWKRASNPASEPSTKRKRASKATAPVKAKADFSILWEKNPRWTVRMFDMLVNPNHKKLHIGLCGSSGKEKSKTSAASKTQLLIELGALIFDVDEEDEEIRERFREWKEHHASSLNHRLVKYVLFFPVFPSSPKRSCLPTWFEFPDVKRSTVLPALDSPKLGKE